jgi:hypothetical protein
MAALEKLFQCRLKIEVVMRLDSGATALSDGVHVRA